MLLSGIKPSFISDPKPHNVLWKIVMRFLKIPKLSWSQKWRYNKPIKPITITLDQHSRIAKNFDDINKKSFSTACLLLKRCLVNLLSLAELFQKFWNKIAQKISTRLARHHKQRFSASDAAASTQSKFCTSWIGIALALLKQWLICIQIFGSLSSGINIKAAIIEQYAASAVASVDT